MQTQDSTPADTLEFEDIEKRRALGAINGLYCYKKKL